MPVFLRVILLSVAWTAGAAAQSFDVRVVDFDLAEDPTGGSLELPFPQGLMFRVRVVNAVPGMAYTLTAPTGTIDRAPLTLLLQQQPTAPCDRVVNDIKRALSTVTSEVEVRSVLRDTRPRAEQACDLAQLDELDALTTTTFPIGVLDEGERFTFEARRASSQGALSWSLTLFIQSQTVSRAELYDESFAVVVGIDEYSSSEWPRLNYAVTDAQAVARFLTDSGFEVIELYDEDATKNAIVAAMQNNLARRVGERDRVLIFFAGHGYTETLGGREWGYVVPYDGGATSAGFISMEELQAQSAKMDGATHQLFIMDSCYGGTLGTRGITVLEPDIPGYLEEVTRRTARQIITAGGKDQQVEDGGPRGHSVFTGYLLEALEEGLGDLNRDGFITFSELNAYLVPRATSSRQTPAVGYLPAHGLGEFTFRVSRDEPGPEPGPNPSGPPVPPSSAEDAYGGLTGATAAEKIASDYLAAMLTEDIDGVLALVDFPFYFDSEILVRREDLENRFRALFAERDGSPEELRIQSIRAQTISSLEADGYDVSRDRVLGNLSLEEDDFGVVITVSTDRLGTEGMLLFARRTPSGLRIVGTWD